MRISVSLAVAAFVLAIGAAAHAQAPIDPYGSGSDDAAVEAPQQAVPQPIDPYSAYPAPPAYGYQPPSAGPPASPPAPPSYQQGYYLYPAQGQAPVYYAPPPNGYRGCCCCCQGQAGQSCGYASPPRLMKKAPPRDRSRPISFGAHLGFWTLNQQVGKDQVSLGGAGFQIRVRSSGRWGFEASQSFLHGSYWGGDWQRDAFPFQASLMFYIFPNRDSRHFNLYGVAGVGLVADSVTLLDENRRQVTQDFTEFELHVGAGAELRWKWFAIEADARYISLWRDGSDTPSSYYGNIQGAPVQSSSYGIQGNLYLSLWF